MKKIVVAAVAACVASGVFAQVAEKEKPAEKPKARIVLVGDIDEASVAQADYCAKRTNLDIDPKKAYRLNASEPTFIRLRSTIHVAVGRIYCDHDWGFTLDADQTYILRHTHTNEGVCAAELFRTVKGADPVPVDVRTIDRKSCLLN
jgi:hypothetical protein